MEGNVPGTIQVRTFTVAHLRDVLKKLGKPCSALNKTQLLQLLDALLREDRERTTRAVLEIYQAHYSQVRFTSSTSAANPIPSHQAAHHSHPQPADPSQLGTPPAVARRILDSVPIQHLEMSAHQGLVEGCRVIGSTIVDFKYPKANKFTALPLTPEEINGLGSQHRLVVRFMLYDPQLQGQPQQPPQFVGGMVSTGPWKFSPIWPKECKLMMNSESIFDTFSKNRLGITTVGFKEPTPAIDVTDRVIAQRGKTGSFEQTGVKFEFSVAMNASSMKWIVVALVLKKKLQQMVVSEILQRSPTQAQCISRVGVYFNSGDDTLGIAEAEVSLKDPASMAPIKIASRGTKCMHLQCFDLFTFLEMNESSRQPTWKCPLCGEEAMVRSIVTDSWFQSIIDSKNKQPTLASSKAQVLEDGSYNLVPDEVDNDNDDEGSDSDDDMVKRPRLSTASPLAIAPASSPPVPKFGKSKADAIELLDDDDMLF